MRTRAVMRLRLPESAPRLSAVQPATYHPRQRQNSTVRRNIPAFQAETTHKNVEVVRVVSMTGGKGLRRKTQRNTQESGRIVGKWGRKLGVIRQKGASRAGRP